ncbi:uncharacterized protein LOC129313385 isoform X2 [Prosopis cineraria]|uniref:uncharacterized protein LOC129313385 isoform X2 n=1 Tax=Prosopis cineraria TaxID=364024 RepID=UPI00240F6D5F|nr:uncharacterized protein LOC129313385 isoform X2 [Prosopis cineraria]
MATLTVMTLLASLTTSHFFPIRRSWCRDAIASPNGRGIYLHHMQYDPWGSFKLSNPRWVNLESFNTAILALNSGFEASITDSSESSAILKNAKIVVESEDGNKLQLRVDLTGDQTQRVFNHVLTNLARTAPPIPGFRRRKGGKTSKVPTSFLLQMLGEERITKFVIQEILNSAMAVKT